MLAMHLIVFFFHCGSDRTVSVLKTGGTKTLSDEVFNGRVEEDIQTYFLYRVFRRVMLQIRTEEMLRSRIAAYTRFRIFFKY